MSSSPTFLQLAKNCKRDMSGLQTYRLALLGDCATQHLSTALKGYAYTKGLALDVLDADYNQVIPQVIDSNSEMYSFKPDAILLYLCSERLYAQWCETAQDARISFANTVLTSIQQYWGHIASNCVAQVLQFTFVENDDFAFGNYAYQNETSFIYQLKKLNMLLMERSNASKVFLVDLNTIQSRIGRNNFYDAKLYYFAKMPISLVAMPLVAESVVRIIQSLLGDVKKCIVLDLDNTLWGGVIGDDGLSGIEIGELGAGLAYTEFQAWLKELKKRGILLAVCSKNEEAAAKEPFKKHSDMILRLEDFAIFVANWENKAANIRYIQQTLNIGIDSMIFIDDNLFERDLVRSLIPEITVPELPDDPAEYLTYLQKLNLFETVSFSSEDAKRTDQYRAEAQRTAIQQQYSNFNEYLQSLEMVATYAPFDNFHIARIAQLTQRSNQFNLRTIRYTESEINAASENPDLITVYFTLKDKLADHGLISVVILEKRDSKTLFINTWLMSCRVLKRGMEEFVINSIINIAQQNGFETVIGEYLKSAKNSMVAGIYEKLGFVKTSEGVFTANVNSFLFNKTFIKEGQHEPQ